MTAPDLTVLPVDHGALTDCPAWEPHHRGKNWAAVITVDPRALGGLARRFWTKARGGDHFYLVPAELRIGDAVEFGADYTTSGGTRRENRHYRVVHAITPTGLSVSSHPTAREAVDAGAALVLSLTATPTDPLHDTTATILADLNATLLEPGQSWYAEPRRFGPATRRRGKLAEIRLRLLTDHAAREMGLLD